MPDGIDLAKRWRIRHRAFNRFNHPRGALRKEEEEEEASLNCGHLSKRGLLLITSRSRAQKSRNSLLLCRIMTAVQVESKVPSRSTIAFAVTRVEV